MRLHILSIILFALSLGLFSDSFSQQTSPQEEIILRTVHDENAGTISIFRNDEDEPILIQNAQPEIRPYIHPITAPDGNGILTQLRPDHHTHQTGLYWGLKRVNERDYFMACCKPGQTGYYRRVSANVLVPNDKQVKWQTVYDLLNEEGQTILTEIQTWSLKQKNDEFILDLEWQGQAKMDVTVGEYFVGGLFLRMPWYERIDGEAVNASGQKNNEAEAQRSIWLDTGMEIEGRDDWGHIAIFDHPNNTDFPISWRVDGELGVGPSRQITGDWTLQPEEVETVRYRLIIYTGELDAWEMNQRWLDFITIY